jgi:hypothetical protein
MRFLALIVLTALLGGCSHLSVTPKSQVKLGISEAVLRGEAPCKIQVTVDGKEVFVLNPVGNVVCPLPTNLLTPRS